MPKWIGALVPLSLLAIAATTPARAATYTVNDFVLGGQVPSDSAAYRDYRCGPSEQFEGYVWCQKNRQGGERRGPFSVTQSLLHARDGKIAYINRQQDPVIFAPNDVDEDIRTFSRRIGAQPRITKLPRRGGGPEGVMALWGDVVVEPLDADSIKVLADGKSPRKGFLVDYLGNLTRSAQDGMPVFRITGGAGFIWAASFDQRGRGTLRLTAVDASMLSPAVADATAPKPVAESLSPEATADAKQTLAAVDPAAGTGRVRTEIVDPKTETATPEKPVAERTISERATSEVAFTDTQAQANVEPVRFDVQSTNAAGTEGEVARLRSATRIAYAIIAGLLTALAAAAFLFMRRRSRASAGTLAGEAAGRASVAALAPAASARAAVAATPPLAAEPQTIESGISSIVQTVFDSPVAARATAGDAAEARSAALPPAGLEEQSALSIVPNDLPERAETAAPEPDDDPVKRLVELAKLRASGMLTEGEFNQLKASIIAATARDSASASDRPPHAAL